MIPQIITVFRFNVHKSILNNIKETPKNDKRLF